MADRRPRAATVRRATLVLALGLVLLLLASSYANAGGLPSARSAPRSPGLAGGAGRAASLSSPTATSPAIADPAATLPVPLDQVERSLAEGAGPAAGSSLRCTSASADDADCVPALLSADGPVVWNNESPDLADPANHPGAGYASSLAYDAADGVYVLFGGCLASACPSNATWLYFAGAWENVTAVYPGPSARYAAAMDFDPLFQAVLLYGGCGVATCPLGDSWTFNESYGWVNQTSHGCALNVCPTAAWGASLAWDPLDQVSVLVDGCSDASCDQVVDQTFLDFGPTDGGVYWDDALPASSPVARSFAQMAWDPAEQAVLLFGGLVSCGNGCSVSSNDTWTYTGTAGWTELAPTASPEGRAAGALTWDGPLAEMVLTGGYNSSTGGLLSSTWTFASSSGGSSWTNITSTVGGPARAWMAVAENNSFWAPWYIGGESPDGAVQSDQWALGAAPTSAVATAQPDPSEVFNATLTTWFWVNNTVAGGTAPYYQQIYFPQYNFLVPDGPYNANVRYTDYLSTPGSYLIDNTIVDSVGLLAADTVTVVINNDPSVSIGSGSSGDTGQTMNFAATIGTGTGVAPFSYNWSFGDGGPVGHGANAAHAFAVAGTFNVTVTVTDYFGFVNSSYVLVTIAPAPSVAVTASPTATDAGRNVTFAATASNGTPPYTYSWTFGDGGTGAAATVTHAYATGGSFTATVTLTDGTGATATRSVAVTIADPLVATISSTPAAPSVGTSVAFAASSTGGTGTISYAWSFGDGTTGTGSTTTHAYTAAGSYTVTLTATDAVGERSSSTVVVTVAAVVKPGGSGSSGPSTLDYALLAVGIAVVLGVLAAVFSRRRRPSSVPAPGGPPAAAEEPAGPPGAAP